MPELAHNPQRFTILDFRNDLPVYDIERLISARAPQIALRRDVSEDSLTSAKFVGCRFCGFGRFERLVPPDAQRVAFFFCAAEQGLERAESRAEIRVARRVAARAVRGDLFHFGRLRRFFRS